VWRSQSPTRRYAHHRLMGRIPDLIGLVVYSNRPLCPVLVRAAASPQRVRTTFVNGHRLSTVKGCIAAGQERELPIAKDHQRRGGRSGSTTQACLHRSQRKTRADQTQGHRLHVVLEGISREFAAVNIPQDRAEGRAAGRLGTAGLDAAAGCAVPRGGRSQTVVTGHVLPPVAILDVSPARSRRSSCRWWH